MRRPRMLWVSLGLFGVLFSTFLGFWLWAEFGFERTIIIYEAAEEPLVKAVAPRAAGEEADVEEAMPAPTAEAPPGLPPVRRGPAGRAGEIACTWQVGRPDRRQ